MPRIEKLAFPKDGECQLCIFPHRRKRDPTGAFSRRVSFVGMGSGLRVQPLPKAIYGVVLGEIAGSQTV